MPVKTLAVQVLSDNKNYVRRRNHLGRLHNFGWTLLILGYLILIGVFYYYVLPDAMRP